MSLLTLACRHRPVKCTRLILVDCAMQLRARVWPVLLGVEGVSVSQDEYMQWAHEKHADSSVVDCDVQRSLWSYTQGTGKADLSLPTIHSASACCSKAISMLSALTHCPYSRLSGKLPC